jgi:protocatechuate 3,4-dioxygenase, beta subunit
MQACGEQAGARIWSSRMSPSRRLVLAQLGAGAFAASAVAQTQLALTPEQTEGPFYPDNPPAERDADLTRLAGRSQRAAGQIIEVRVRVLDRRGQPLRGARVEMWQANAAGRYDHPGDNNAAPLDPNFQGYARLSTGPDGLVRITTVKPGAYPFQQRMRTPHLHWMIAANGNELTTQMYFPGGVLNGDDRVLDDVTDPRLVTARTGFADEAGALAYDWDVVLNA